MATSSNTISIALRFGAKAMQYHGKHSKFEFKADGAYFLSSQYVNVGDAFVLLEVIQKFNDTTVFDVLGTDEIDAMVTRSNEKGCMR